MVSRGTRPSLWQPDRALPWERAGTPIRSLWSQCGFPRCRGAFAKSVDLTIHPQRSAPFFRPLKRSSPKRNERIGSSGKRNGRLAEA